MDRVLSSTGDLPLVRRLEAVSFRAWPAGLAVYDGSWQLRLTPGHPSLRINCVVPLDPSDHHHLPERIEAARQRFADHGRSLVLRQTPLSPPALLDYLSAQGWQPFETVDVMTSDLAALDLPDTLDHLPGHDVDRFVNATLAITSGDPALKPALAGIVAAIKPPSGLFVKESGGEEAAGVLLCVHDNDLAGLLGLAVAKSRQREGIGLELVSSALRWARIRGACRAWLQVLSSNEPALALYRRLGFRKAYEYRYWKQEAAP